jgi:hypothetical protein
MEEDSLPAISPIADYTARQVLGYEMSSGLLKGTRRAIRLAVWEQVSPALMQAAAGPACTS